IPGFLSFPNGKHLTVQDTWGSGRSQTRKEVFNDLLMSASGIARLTGNTDALNMTGTQTVMTFVPKYGHNHYDILNMHLHAYGVELLPDLG
ncbi:MAG TPA: hypothetical protein DDZ89_19320, partial [Clostridiales bacterium]|nr:hypothetical protein [Clostridiales bacterium]